MVNAMTPKLNDEVAKDVMQVLLEKGSEGFGDILRKLLNEVMKAERAEVLGAQPYERTSERQGYANGFKPKTIYTGIGPLTVEIPQTRGLSFYPKSIEKGCRSERALKLAIAEMYVNGVSTRRVTKITAELCGLEISSTQVSRLAKELDEEIEKFRNRPLGHVPYIYLDAQYQKIRHLGHVRDMAVLIATGIDADGMRQVLGLSISLSEAEVHWRQFLESLNTRGLHGVEYIVSDDHQGLRAARNAVFPSVMWQRCQFHFAQNAQHMAIRKPMKREIAQDIRDIFNAPSLAAAQQQVSFVVKKYENKNPAFAAWLENSIHECFSVFSLPREYWVKLRTVNPLENLNREIRRRTNLAAIFPNDDSCIRLIGAVLNEIHDDWTTSEQYYLNMEHWRQSKKYDSRIANDVIYRKKVA